MNRRVALVLIGLVGVIGGCAREPDVTAFVSLAPYGDSTPDQEAAIQLSQDRNDRPVFTPSPPSRVRGKEEDVCVRARILLPLGGPETVEIEVTQNGRAEIVSVPIDGLVVSEVSLPGGVTCFVGIGRKDG